jgi:hypothetical protein
VEHSTCLTCEPLHQRNTSTHNQQRSGKIGTQFLRHIGIVYDAWTSTARHPSDRHAIARCDLRLRIAAAHYSCLSAMHIKCDGQLQPIASMQHQWTVCTLRIDAPVVHEFVVEQQHSSEQSSTGGCLGCIGPRRQHRKVGHGSSGEHPGISHVALTEAELLICDGLCTSTQGAHRRQVQTEWMTSWVQPCC